MGSHKHLRLLHEPKFLLRGHRRSLLDSHMHADVHWSQVSHLSPVFALPRNLNGPAPTSISYEWTDHNRRSVSLPATTCTDYMITWVQNCLDDETTFPTRPGHDFPPASSSSFAARAKAIFAQLFRVFAHIYHAHFTDLLPLHSDRPQE